jgi:2-polyprenyl-3-methyl-5-hydroxy-6-metoxy-1,4-benzoquinol methylase
MSNLYNTQRESGMPPAPGHRCFTLPTPLALRHSVRTKILDRHLTWDEGNRVPGAVGDPKSYIHEVRGLGLHHCYLLPPIIDCLGPSKGRSLFEIGFGNASAADYFHKAGFQVAGIEPSADGVEIARLLYPELTGLQEGNAYEDLPGRFGTFDVVLSLEVVEHLYSPREFAANAFRLLNSGGIAFISTPYNGWLKNVALALLGQFDHHHSPLWDHGHIKFWSLSTLSQLLAEAGFKDIEFRRVGRVPPLAKSMIAIARKP